MIVLWGFPLSLPFRERNLHKKPTLTVVEDDVGYMSRGTNGALRHDILYDAK